MDVNGSMGIKSELIGWLGVIESGGMKDWSNIQKEYKGKWVALEDDEVTVIASGKTLLEALGKSKKKGNESPIFARMPSELIGFVGGAR